MSRLTQGHLADQHVSKVQIGTRLIAVGTHCGRGLTWGKVYIVVEQPEYNLHRPYVTVRADNGTKINTRLERFILEQDKEVLK